MSTETSVQPTNRERARPRPTFILRDLGTLVLSAVLALIVWLIAVNQENPLITQEFSERIPVTVLGLGEDLIPVQPLSDETVRLVLRAPRSSWENLSASDFRATVDLTSMGPGEHDVVVRITRRDPQVSVIEIQRPELSVTLDRLISKEVPVQVEPMDGTAFGYDWQTPIYSPITVTVSGPETQVQQVVKARAEVYLRGAKSQVERVQTLVPTDAQNRPIDSVTVEPAQVQVVVPVEQWPGRKEVAVRVKLSGRPAAGYRLSSVKVEPSTIVLQGEADALSDVPGYVETEPLSLENATADLRKRVQLILPEGVTSFDGDTVLATAGITPIEGGVTVTESLVVQGLCSGLSADASLDEVEVSLSGPLPLLESLNQDDVFVILDLTGLIPGTHAVKPRVALPDGIRLDGVIPETVEVVIKPREEGADIGLPRLPALETPAVDTTPPITATSVVTEAVTPPAGP
ncbi:MAG: hypothetical protein H3C34_16485 [Caldilineaceae bacterium]|nr:hypothetical protein [Caldilineaceae bacterium]